jgi:hypothetical protein
MMGANSSVVVKTLSRRLDRTEVANFRREMQSCWKPISRGLFLILVR